MKRCEACKHRCCDRIERQVAYYLLFFTSDFALPHMPNYLYHTQAFFFTSSFNSKIIPQNLGTSLQPKPCWGGTQVSPSQNTETYFLQCQPLPYHPQTLPKLQYSHISATPQTTVIRAPIYHHNASK